MRLGDQEGQFTVAVIADESDRGLLRITFACDACQRDDRGDDLRVIEGGDFLLTALERHAAAFRERHAECGRGR